MTEPEIPGNETSRLKAIDQCGILYSPAEERFDRITRLACRSLDMPVALITIVGEEIQWFKSRQGLNTSETSRKVSFCAHAILKDNTFVVHDATQHPDFFDNPLVLNSPYVRFYAGEPLKFGVSSIGTLCIIDYKPRNLSIEDLDTLKSLAKWVELELKLNLYKRSQKDLIRKLDITERKSLLDPMLGIWNQKGIDTLLDREIHMDGARPKNMTLLMISLNELPQGRGKSKKVREDLLFDAVRKIRMILDPQHVLGITDKDELVVLIADQDNKTGYDLSTKILNAIVGDVLSEDNQISSTSNIGIITNKLSAIKKVRDFIDQARESLAYSKKRGHNHIYYAIAGSKGGYYINN